MDGIALKQWTVSVQYVWTGMPPMANFVTVIAGNSFEACNIATQATKAQFQQATHVSAQDVRKIKDITE